MQEHIAGGGLIIAATHAPLGLAAQEIRIGSDGAGRGAAS
jgi:heme exporter protein A